MHLIKISSDIKELNGRGEEWLVAKDGETIIAKFFDGNFMQAVQVVGSEEPTVKAA